MLLLRAYDERAVALQRQGRIGAYPMFWGEEGIQAGAMHALRAPDWVVPHLPPERASDPPRAATRASAPATSTATRGRSSTPPTSAARPNACRSRRISRTPLAGHGGRRSRGVTTWPWRSSARVRPPRGLQRRAEHRRRALRAPVVFVCTNNRWAVSTPVERQTAARSIVDKAAGIRHRRASRSTDSTPALCAMSSASRPSVLARAAGRL